MADQAKALIEFLAKFNVDVDDSAESHIGDLLANEADIPSRTWELLHCLYQFNQEMQLGMKISKPTLDYALELTTQSPLRVESVLVSAHEPQDTGPELLLTTTTASKELVESELRKQLELAPEKRNGRPLLVYLQESYLHEAFPPCVPIVRGQSGRHTLRAAAVFVLMHLMTRVSAFADTLKALILWRPLPAAVTDTPILPLANRSWQLGVAYIRAAARERMSTMVTAMFLDGKLPCALWNTTLLDTLVRCEPELYYCCSNKDCDEGDNDEELFDPDVDDIAETTDYNQLLIRLNNWTRDGKDTSFVVSLMTRCVQAAYYEAGLCVQLPPHTSEHLKHTLNILLRRQALFLLTSDECDANDDSACGDEYVANAVKSFGVEGRVTDLFMTRAEAKEFTIADTASDVIKNTRFVKFLEQTSRTTLAAVENSILQLRQQILHECMVNAEKAGDGNDYTDYLHQFAEIQALG